MTDRENQKWVAYYRVSTQRQGESGLGLEAQQVAVERFVTLRGGALLAALTETESGKRVSNRPRLQEALALCRRQKATLVIAKLDRLARNMYFIAGLMETNIDFIAVDQPTKDRFTLHMQAAFAEEEARRISLRTKEALAAAKRRGVEIGATGRIRAAKLKEQALAGALQYRALIEELQAEGFTTRRAIRDELNRRGIVSPGGRLWHLPTVQKLLSRLASTECAG